MVTDMSAYVYSVRAKVLNVHMMDGSVVQPRFSAFLCRSHDELHSGARLINTAWTLYERKGIADYIYTERGHGIISVWKYGKASATFYDDVYFGNNVHVCHAQKVGNKWTAMSIKQVADRAYEIMCEKMENGNLTIFTNIGPVRTVRKLDEYLATFETEGDRTNFLTNEI